MKKHIIVVGPSRSGKSTLSRNISKELNYNLIKLDDLVSGFEYAFPNLGIIHDNQEEKEIARKFTKFIIGFLMECQENINKNNDIYFVIEGVHIDFDILFEKFDVEDFHIIGLFYGAEEKTLFNKIREFDNSDEWTYYNNDEELLKNCHAFLNTNTHFKKVYKKYKINSYDMTNNRNEKISEIVETIRNLNI